MHYHAGTCVANGKKAGYVSTFGSDGKRTRRFFKTYREAAAWVLDQQIEEANLGPVWATVPADERLDLLTFWRECRALSVTPRAVLDHWKATR